MVQTSLTIVKVSIVYGIHISARSIVSAHLSEMSYQIIQHKSGETMQELHEKIDLCNSRFRRHPCIAARKTHQTKIPIIFRPVLAASFRAAFFVLPLPRP